MASSQKRLAFGALVAVLTASLWLVGQVQAQEDSNLHPLRTHSIYMPYIDQDLQNRWFDFGGDALVNTNRFIRLTQDAPSQSGWLWSRLPLEATNFQIEFEFRVGGKSDGLNGDGFAVWLTSERAESGPVFGNRDRFEGVGIFFDTYANARQAHSFPYVMAMVGDGKTSYDNNNDGLSNRAGGCEANFRGVTTPTKARITYSASSHALNLKLHTKAWDQWDDCFTIMDVKLPSHTYLGFTSHTGEVYDRHDIISVTTSMMSKGENFIGQRRNNAPPPPNKSSFGWYLKFLAVSAIFIVVIALAFQMSKKNDMRRF